MHSWARAIHWVENHEIARAIMATFETDDSDRVTWLLQVNRWEKSFVNVGTVVGGSLGKIGFGSRKECFMGFR